MTDDATTILRFGTFEADLRTGELRAHDPGDYITKLAGVEYREDARCESTS